MPLSSIHFFKLHSTMHTSHRTYPRLLAFVALLLPLRDAPQLPPASANGHPDFTPCRITNTAFKSGERLTHKVFYNWNFVWMGAGETTSRVQTRGSDYYITIKGSTYPSYDWFYRIRDHFETTVDAQTLRPRTCMRYIEEGKYRLYDRVDFQEGQAHSHRGKSADQTHLKSIAIEGCMHDIVSMIYYFRNVNFGALKEGTHLPMQLFMDREAWQIQLTYDKTETLNVKGLGKHRAHRLSTRVTAGELFDENSSVTVWVSADANKVPLLIELNLAIGSIKVVLDDYQGLRHPLRSAVS